MPLKVIVLDVTQSEHDGSHDIHGHGFLDAKRWALAARPSSPAARPTIS